MTNFLTLWRRELAAWFLVPVHYAMMAGYLTAAGLIFWNVAARNAGAGLLASEVTFGAAFYWLLVGAAVAVTASRPMAEERERGTFEVLMTAPVSDAEVLLAKYAAVLVWLLAMFAPTLAYVPILRWFGPGTAGLDPGATAAGAAMLVMVAGLLAAVGILASTVCGRQAAAGMLTLAAGCLWLFAGEFRRLSTVLTSLGLTSLLSPTHHVFQFAGGLVDSRPAVFYASTTAWLLFANVRLLEWLRMRRLSVAVNAAVTILLAGLLAGMANVLAARHAVRRDWSHAQRHTLTDRTVRILRALEEPVHLTVLSPSGSRRLDDVRPLLERLRERSAQLVVESVDPDRDLARTKELAVKYRLGEADVLVVDAARAWEAIPLETLYTPRRGTPAAAGVTPDQAFAGETVIASAIRRLAQSPPPVVAFTSGHGERDPNDFDPLSGFSDMARMLRDDHAVIQPVLLAKEGAVSNRCAVLVVAAPLRRFTREEVHAVGQYLGQGGRVLFLVEPNTDTALDDLLAEWGVRPGADRVVERSGTGRGAFDTTGLGGGFGWGEIHVTQYGGHAITRGLEGWVTTFYGARSVAAADDPAAVPTPPADRTDKPRVTVLAWSSADTWAESDFDQDPPQFDAAFDRPGPVPVALCVERGSSAGIDVQIRATRLVVVGDGEFACNGHLSGANADLFMNAFHWLLGDEHLVAAASRVRDQFDVRIPPRRRIPAFAAVVLGVPASVGLLGLLVAFARRDRRARAAATEPADGDHDG